MENKPRKPAHKRMFSAIVDSMSDIKLFNENTTIETWFECDTIQKNTKIQTERKSLLENTFTPIPKMFITKDNKRGFQQSSDTLISLYRMNNTVPSNYINTLPVFFDDANDTWTLLVNDQECYWKLKPEAKLAAVNCWLKDDEMLGQIAERVQQRITEIGQVGKKEFLKIVGAQKQESLEKDILESSVEVSLLN